MLRLAAERPKHMAVRYLSYRLICMHRLRLMLSAALRLYCTYEMALLVLSAIDRVTDRPYTVHYTGTCTIDVCLAELLGL